jgi:hypothetical protein
MIHAIMVIIALGVQFCSLVKSDYRGETDGGYEVTKLDPSDLWRIDGLGSGIPVAAMPDCIRDR